MTTTEWLLVGAAALIVGYFVLRKAPAPYTGAETTVATATGNSAATFAARAMNGA